MGSKSRTRLTANILCVFVCVWLIIRKEMRHLGAGVQLIHFQSGQLHFDCINRRFHADCIITHKWTGVESPPFLSNLVLENFFLICTINYNNKVLIQYRESAFCNNQPKKIFFFPAHLIVLFCRCLYMLLPSFHAKI